MEISLSCLSRRASGQSVSQLALSAVYIYILIEQALSTRLFRVSFGSCAYRIVFLDGAEASVKGQRSR